MSGIGMYALLRVWGVSVMGAILGGMVWELNGHNAFWLILEQCGSCRRVVPVKLLARLSYRKQSFKWAIAAEQHRPWRFSL
jgi:hypothetical protein